jgi:hypothetical protein
MSGLPILACNLDDGSGTYPYDVKSFVRLPAGVSITKGAGDEFSDVQPSALSLTFDNTTGVFTLGSGTYGIAIDQRIQVALDAGAGAVKVFTGYVQDWPVAWPDGSDQFAIAEVTAVDRLSRLARRKLRDVIGNEYVLDTPAAYYNLAEAENSTTAGDTSTNLVASLMVAGVGTELTFGNATGPGTDGLSAAEFTGGQFLTSTTSAAYIGSGSWTVEFFMLAAAPGAAVMTPVILNGGGSTTVPEVVFQIAATTGVISASIVDPSGTPSTTVPTSTNVADGSTHHIALTQGGGFLTIYIDGTSAGFVASSAFTTPPTYLTIGSGSANTSFLALTGVVAHVATYISALSSTRIAAHASAGLRGFATDTADQRVARLASYANIVTGDQALETGQQPSIAAQDTNGQTVLDAINNVVTAEGGLVFIRGDGKLVMQSKGHRVLTATGTAALAITDPEQVNPDLTIGGAKNYLVNTATGARHDGAQQRAVYSAGVTANEEYPQDFDRALLTSDELVKDLLQWTVTAYGTARPRIAAITIDLLTTASAGTVQTILALELGDLITLTGLPSQKPATLAGLLVVGSSMSLTHDSWTVTFNTVPADIFRGPVVDRTSATCDTGYPVYF